MNNKPKGLRKLTGMLVGTAVAVSAIGLAPHIPAFFPGDTALADAVRLQAPQSGPDFADVVEAVSPAVVSVRVESDLRPASDDGSFRFDRRDGGLEDLPPFMREHPFFRDFFDRQDRGDDDRRYGRRGDDDRKYGRRGDDDRKYGRNQRRHGDGFPRRFGMSQGSGFFVSEDGYVVTNHHVVENGSKFTVVLDDGTEYDAKLVGADSRTDLAVLKVDDPKRNFTYVNFSQDDVRVGQWVVAVGNPFGLGGTVTAGIVSAHNRALASRYDDLIQIDAAVNKGNSGGPAFNLKGEVIGINNSIFSPNGGNIGIGFAIPANAAAQVVEDLIDNGQVVRGWLGVRIQPVTADIAESIGLTEDKGAIVTEPQSDSPAEKAGIKSGDVITAVDGEQVKDPRTLAHKIAGYDPDSKVKVTIWRDGKTKDVDVTLGELDGERIASRGDDGDGNPAADTPRVGLSLELSPDGDVVVAGIEPGSGAEEKDVRPGDVILSVNGEEVSDPADVAKVVRQAGELDRKAALFQIRRDGETMFVAIPLSKRG